MTPTYENVLDGSVTVAGFAAIAMQQRYERTEKCSHRKAQPQLAGFSAFDQQHLTLGNCQADSLGRLVFGGIIAIERGLE